MILQQNRSLDLRTSYHENNLTKGRSHLVAERLNVKGHVAREDTVKESFNDDTLEGQCTHTIFIAGIRDRHITLEDRAQWLTSDIDNCSCCCELQAAGDQWPDEADKWPRSSRARRLLRTCGGCCVCVVRCIRRSIKKLVEHKYFQQGILVAILINTLSMGIEYHNQVSVPLSADETRCARCPVFISRIEASLAGWQRSQ